jgi:DNA-binding transcriptional MocR family regulator/dihydrodipicolinate reductase
MAYTYGQYKVTEADECINLGVGQPRSDMLPLDIFNSALKKLSNNTNPAFLQYGSIQGYDEFRSDLTDCLNTMYSCGTFGQHKYINKDQMLITSGITGALQLILSVLKIKDVTIYVEDPTYFLALKIFKDFGLNIVGIPIDENGIRVDILEKELEKNTDSITFLYIIPFFNNPTGYSLSGERLNELIELADFYTNLFVLSDEVYFFLSFIRNEIHKPLATYHKNFISMGSFSKILAPSLRMGWIICNPEIMKIFVNSGVLDSGGCVNPIGCGIIHELLKMPYFDMTGLTHHFDIAEEKKCILHSIIEYWSKYLYINSNLLYSSLEGKSFIESINPSKGGYFVWLKLKDIYAENLSKKMEKYKIKFHHGNKFSISQSYSNYIRLSYSWYEGDDYNLFAQRLSGLIEYEKSKIGVVVLGGFGKLGKLIVENIGLSKEFYLVKILDRTMNIDDLPKSNIVIIDVSSVEGTLSLLIKLLGYKLYYPLIIGTTGALPLDLITEYSKYSPVALSSNFSFGINQFKKIIGCIELDEWSDISMIEKHHDKKKDAPSGTAIMLSKLIQVSKIASIREGDIIGEHELILKNDDECITIKHCVINRNVFAKGSMYWIKFIVKADNGIYEKIE